MRFLYDLTYMDPKQVYSQYLLPCFSTHPISFSSLLPALVMPRPVRNLATNDRRHNLRVAQFGRLRIHVHSAMTRRSLVVVAVATM